MGDLIQTAAAILSQSERRLEVSAQNVANISTPGYKRRVSFADLLPLSSAGDQISASELSGADLSAGSISLSDNPLDLALLSDGWFVVRAADTLQYTRQGQFERDQEGHLITTQGFVLQSAGGGDLQLHDGTVEIMADGTVTQLGDLVGRIAVAQPSSPQVLQRAEGAFFHADDLQMTQVAQPNLRRGALEASNVSMGSEMMSLIETLRRAEAAQRIVGVYDDLIGRAVTTFGQNR